MELTEQQLTAINKRLTRRHGEDIASDVIVALLRRQNPIEHVDRWASAYAYGLKRRENSRLSRLMQYDEELFNSGVTATRQVLNIGCYRRLINRSSGGGRLFPTTR